MSNSDFKINLYVLTGLLVTAEIHCFRILDAVRFADEPCETCLSVKLSNRLELVDVEKQLYLVGLAAT